MNVGDTEIVISITPAGGLSLYGRIEEADVILINTCSVRDNAEQLHLGPSGRPAPLPQGQAVASGGHHRLHGRAAQGRPDRGTRCRGDRGRPDAYRDLPRLLLRRVGRTGVNTLLSQEGLCGDRPRAARPQRRERLHRHHARLQQLLLLLRGWCPIRAASSGAATPRRFWARARELLARGCREVTLLGRNVNSYLRFGEVDFPRAMRRVADISPCFGCGSPPRTRRDISDRLLEVMAASPTSAGRIHLPT